MQQMSKRVLKWKLAIFQFINNITTVAEKKKRVSKWKLIQCENHKNVATQSSMIFLYKYKF